MNVVAVVPNFLLGGAERQATAFLELAQERLGWKVSLVAFDTEGPVRALCERAGIAWRAVPKPILAKSLTSARSLTRFGFALRALKPDVVLSYVSFPNVVCGLTWRLSGARAHVWSQRAASLVDGGGLYRWARLGASMTRHFVANSREGARFLESSLNVRPERTWLVQNAVARRAPERSREEWRSRLRIGPAQPVAVMVANLHRFKDHRTLLRSWALVKDRSRGESPPQLLLAGRAGDAELEAKAIAFDLGLGGSVRFLGFEADVAGLLQTSDLCVHSSHEEGSPNAVLEAMASGLPVVGTDLPGMREALGPAADECLAPPQDVTALADLISRYLGNPNLARAAGEANQRRAIKEFGPEKMLLGTARVILAATGKADPSAGVSLSRADEPIGDESEGSLVGRLGGKL